MKREIKSKLYPINLLKLCLQDSFHSLKIRRKPHTIQLPITSRCNSRCITCNIWKHKENIDIDCEKLKKLFQGSFFSEVKSVGVNGGEFSLCPSFLEIIDAILVLPKLNNIYLITNGLLPDKIFPLLRKCKELCDEKGVRLNVTLSVDGVGSIHETTRGVPNCWVKTKRLLDEFRDNYDEYASRIMVGCTLSRNNIGYAMETESFLSDYPFKVSYHLAVPNKRIYTFNDATSYYVLEDEHSRLLAMDFFYYLFKKTRGGGQFTYFSQYFFLKNKGGRLARCQYRDRDITIDESLNLYLCATASDSLGNLNQVEIEDAFRNKYREVKKGVLENCETCVHYINEHPTWKGVFEYCRERLVTRYNWHYKFKIVSKW